MSSYKLINAKVRALAKLAIEAAPDGFEVTISEPKRSEAQNRLLWQALTDVSRQVEWYGQYLTPQDWKDVFTASLRKAKVVPGIDSGTFVVTGLHTSRMNKSELSSLMELIFAFGSERGVVFTDDDDRRGLE